MSASIVPPLVPPAFPVDRPGSPARNRRALPLPPVPVSGPSRLICGTALIDRDGRVAEATVIGAMGWQCGVRLDIRVSGGLVLVTADERAVFRVTRPGQLRVPAPVRHWCGLTAGSRVLLVAYPEAGLLVVHPPASLHAMIAECHAAAIGGEAT